MPRVKSFLLLPALVLGACAAAGARPNLPCPTLGGTQLWTDVRWRTGWRVQRNAWTGHHRLLDPKNVRRAWGSLSACGEELRSRATGDVVSDGETLVVLLHGLGRTRRSLAGLEGDLREAGFTTARLSYASMRTDPERAAADVAAVLNDLPEVGRISFVTHSMGALVLRELLARQEDPWRERITVERAFLIAPPSNGAALARRITRLAPARWIAGAPLAVLARSAEDVAPPLPPGLPTMVVAGGRGSSGWNPLVPGDDDGIVGVSETPVPGAEILHVHGVHTVLMNHPEVRDAALRFLAGE